MKKYKDALTCPPTVFSSYLFTGKILPKNSVWNAFGTLSFLDPLRTTLKMSGYALMFDAQDYLGFSFALVFGFEEKSVLDISTYITFSEVVKNNVIIKRKSLIAGLGYGEEQSRRKIV